MALRVKFEDVLESKCFEFNDFILKEPKDYISWYRESKVEKRMDGVIIYISFIKVLNQY